MKTLLTVLIIDLALAITLVVVWIRYRRLGRAQRKGGKIVCDFNPYL